jgi:hypothetical protein
MAANVLQLHKSVPADEVVGTLRRIADDIEGGSLEWPVTTAVLICGHTDGEVTLSDGSLAEESYWTTYVMGPRTSTFTVRGLVASAMRKWNHD